MVLTPRAASRSYTGPVCGVCAPGYYPWGAQCYHAASHARASDTFLPSSVSFATAGQSCKMCDNNFRWVMPFVGVLATFAFVGEPLHTVVACPTRVDCAYLICPTIRIAALFMLPVRPDNTDPIVRAKIVMTFLQVRHSTLQQLCHPLLRLTHNTICQVLGLIKDYAIHWRPKFLMSSLSYFDVLNIGLEITAPTCGESPVRTRHAPRHS